MITLLTGLLSSIASFSATTGTTACIRLLFDEPECPKSLIEK